MTWSKSSAELGELNNLFQRGYAQMQELLAETGVREASTEKKCVDQKKVFHSAREMQRRGWKGADGPSRPAGAHLCSMLDLVEVIRNGWGRGNRDRSLESLPAVACLWRCSRVCGGLWSLLLCPLSEPGTWEGAEERKPATTAPAPGFLAQGWQTKAS